MIIILGDIVMSCCSCLICGETVPQYEKYCEDCLSEFGLQQGDWRFITLHSRPNSGERTKEIIRHFIQDRINCRGCMR